MADRNLGPSPALESFRPARSFGWAWLVGISVLLVLPMFAILRPDVLGSEGAVAVYINLAIVVPLLAFFMVTALTLPRMRYDLTADELVLSCGWLLKYRVAYRDITDVRTLNLTPSLWSSMRFPGLAMWKVPYADAGMLFMCATRMARGILVITAGDRRFGITPADEPAFLASLMPHLPKDAAPASEQKAAS